MMTSASARRESIERKLDATIFPEIDFRQSEKYCGLTFLARGSEELDKEKKGVNIVYIPSDSSNTEFPVENDGRSFSFSAHNISLREALNIMCELGGFTWKIEDSVVKVRPIKVQPPSGGDSSTRAARVSEPPQK